MNEPDLLTIDINDPEIKWILSLMVITSAKVGRALRDGGQDIPRKVEAEQFAAFVWLIRFYQEHKVENWRSLAQAALNEMTDKAKDKAQ